MKKEIVGSSEGNPQLPFSPATVFNSLIFVSGQVGKSPDGGVPHEFEGEVKQAMSNVESILKQVGSSFENVLKITVYLADINRFPEFNEIYKEYFSGDYPARTTFQVAALPGDNQIEIDAIAFSPEGEA